MRQDNGKILPVLVTMDQRPDQLLTIRRRISPQRKVGVPKFGIPKGIRLVALQYQGLNRSDIQHLARLLAWRER